MRADRPLIVHGLDLSYFTGKLEAYLRAKGIAYRLAEMDTRSFARAARMTGVRQMPQVECADGTWLTDTSAIIAHLERAAAGPSFTPVDALTRFIAHLLEDTGDETLWRPALHYRWSYGDDARLMSARIARGMMRDVPLPLFIRRQIILARQRRIYLREDGVTRGTRGAIEQLYLDALSAMETALGASPYLLGARPTAADFGFFGAMFRHFFCDPTPAAIMRERAPRVLAWVARLWAADPRELAAAPPVEGIPADAVALIALAAGTHLPYLAANARAVAAGEREVQFMDRGAKFRVPASPYRAWCLAQLQGEAQALPPEAAERLAALLGEPATGILRAPQVALDLPVRLTLPIQPPTDGEVRKAVKRTWS